LQEICRLQQILVGLKAFSDDEFARSQRRS
jgi:hypothetical protein